LVDIAAQEINLLQAAVVLFGAPLLAGVYARARAWTESRQGPSVLQPYYDLAKYLRKETLLPDGSSAVFVLGPLVAFGAYLTIAVVVPVVTPYPLPYAGLVDLLGGGLLFGLAALVVALAALDSGSNYAALGASRATVFGAFGEPVLIMVFVAVAVITGTNNPYVTTQLLAGSASAYLSPTHLLATAAFFLLLLAETGKLPVESPGHLEFGLMGEAQAYEHSGRLYGLLQWDGWLKQFLLATIFLNVFAAPWGLSASPTLAAALANTGLLGAKLAGLAGLLVLVEASLAKIRLFKVQDFLVIAFSLGLLSVVTWLWLGVS
jgi:formate hydrogenlyase subunit 4